MGIGYVFGVCDCVYGGMGILIGYVFGRGVWRYMYVYRVRVCRGVEVWVYL